MAKKARKYGEAWKDVRIDSDQFDAVYNKLLRPPEPPITQPDESSIIETSPVGGTSQDSQSSPAPETSLDYNGQEARSETSLVPETSPVLQTSLNIGLLSTLPDVKGFTRLTHQITDHLLPQLGAYEQVIYIHLLRLTWGHNKPSITIGMPRLAERAQVSIKTVQRSLTRLEAKGLIERVGFLFGYGKDQGLEIRVVPPSSLVRETSQAPKTSQVLQADMNRRTTLKENTQTQGGVGVASRFTLEECRRYAAHLKSTGQGITNPGGYATKIFRSGEADPLIEAFLNPAPQLDINQCPDCKGTGFIYPQGIEKGIVAKCKHEKLK